MPFGSSDLFLATNDPEADDEEQQVTQVYEKHDNLLHGQKKKRLVGLSNNKQECVIHFQQMDFQAMATYALQYKESFKE